MRTILILLAILALAIPAGADHCATFSTSDPEFDSAFGASVEDAPRFYVENDPCHMHGMCVFSIWVYRESNGIGGLQRDDEIVDDTCHGMIAGDTIIL